MTKCAVEECHGRSGHMFPRDPDIRRKWMEFARRTSIGAYALLCKAHFRKEDFISLPVIPGLPAPRKRLKPDAVPSIRQNVPTCQDAAISNSPGSRAPKRLPTDYDRLAQIQLANLELKQKEKNDVRVLSEKELFRMIERIKQKLKDNAPESAEFPSAWNDTPQAKKPIREGYPPFSMPCLIALGIESAPMKIATKYKIIRFIGMNFPCYKLHPQRGRDWQTRVREILEACKVFRKISPEKTPDPEASVVFWTFSPDVETNISKELYEAFTNARFDDSTLDYERAAVREEADVLAVRTEDMVVSRINDINEDLLLEHPEDRFSVTNPSGSSRVDLEERIDEVDLRIVPLERLKVRRNEQEDRKRKKTLGGARRKRLSEEEEEEEEEDTDDSWSEEDNMNIMKGKYVKKAKREEASDDFVEEAPSAENGQVETEHPTSDSEPGSDSDDQDSNKDSEEVELTLYKCRFCKFVSSKDKVTTAHMVKTHLKEDSSWLGSQN